MKRLFAMLLAALMLISACAIAEGGFGGKLVVKDVVIDMGGQVIDLSGVDFTLALASDGTQGGLRMAVDAAGASVFNAILASDAEQMTLRADGISDVYAVRYEDLLNMLMETEDGAEFMDAFVSGFEAGYEAGLSVGTDMAQDEVPAEISALMEHAVEIFSNAITDGGTMTTVDGEEYAAYNIAISQEQMDVLLSDLVAVADAYAQNQLAGSGYDSYAQMFAEAQLHLSVNGEVYMNETTAIANIDIQALTAGMDAPETLNLYGDMHKDLENETVDFSRMISIVDGEETDVLYTVIGTYAKQDGEFASLELHGAGASDENGGFYLGVYAPEEQGNGLWQVSVGSQDETASFHLAFGTADGLNQFSAQVISGDQSVYFDYLGADGTGNLSFGMASDGESVADVSAVVALAEDDGAWLPGAVDAAVDLLTIDEAQTEKLGNEGMMLLLNAMAGLSQANESLAAMLGEMMG